MNIGQIGNNNGHEMHMIPWDAVEWAISRISSSFGSMLSTGANTVSLFFLAEVLSFVSMMHKTDSFPCWHCVYQSGSLQDVDLECESRLRWNAQELYC